MHDCAAMESSKRDDMYRVRREGQGDRGMAIWPLYGDPIVNASIAHLPPFRPSSSPMSGGERTGTAHDFRIS